MFYSHTRFWSDTMIISANLAILYSDTLVSDIFITEYMPSLDGDCLKIYMYILFLQKHSKNIQLEEISKILQINLDIVKTSLHRLDNLGLIEWADDSIVLVDIKDVEIKKVFRPKTTSLPSDAILSSERNQKRNAVITSINNTYFQGIMSPSWYTDIDTWFDRYKFDEDVMMYLFSHCFEHNGLAKNYITKVAESWYSKNITNVFHLEKYMEEYNRFTEVRGQISKKLKFSRNFTEFEDLLIEKWVMTFGYSIDIIEIALKKTISKSNPNLKYIDSIITEWHNNNLKTKEEIMIYDKNRKQTQSNKQISKYTVVPQETNYEQREYSEEYLEGFYENYWDKHL